MWHSVTIFLLCFWPTRSFLTVMQLETETKHINVPFRTVHWGELGKWLLMTWPGGKCCELVEKQNKTKKKKGAEARGIRKWSVEERQTCASLTLLCGSFCNTCQKTGELCNIEHKHYVCMLEWTWLTWPRCTHCPLITERGCRHWTSNLTQALLNNLLINRQCIALG